MGKAMQCRAKSKRSGSICKKDAMKNGLCHMHGGKQDTSQHGGNTWALKHGGFRYHLETDEEKEIYRYFKESILSKFPYLNNPIDRVQLDILGMNYIRLIRVYNCGTSSSISKVGSEFRNNLRSLRLTRDTREPESQTENIFQKYFEIIEQQEKETAQ
jgi:hypothetical protein